MEDIKIVELFLNRIEPTIQETHLKYGKLCKKIAFNLLFNNEDAEEVLNDTYLGVWDSIPPEKPVYLISEISSQMNLSESNIKSELFRSRKKLKKYLTERGIELWQPLNY